MKSSLIKLKSQPSYQSIDEIVFNKLQKKIHYLKKKEKKQIELLEECLQYYKQNIYQEELKFFELLSKRAEILYEEFYKKKKYPKQKSQILKSAILNDIDTIFNMNFIKEVPEKILEIDKKLQPELSKKEKQNNFDCLQDSLKKEGIDVDLSNINPNEDSEDEVLKKMFESFFESEKNNFFKKSDHNKIKEDLVCKDITTLYKKLARSFHPDLEQDLGKKQEKETLMKKLTVAYKNRDFYTLLNFEKEYIYEDQQWEKRNLKYYINLLKEQLIHLQNKIQTLFLDGNYQVLQRFYKMKFTGLNPLKLCVKNLKKDNKQLKSLIDDLQSPKANETVNLLFEEYMIFDFF
jgi:hypothetical protein